MKRYWQKKPSPANSKMWSAFIVRLKQLEIYIQSRVINCQLIPGFSGVMTLYIFLKKSENLLKGTESVNTCLNISIFSTSLCSIYI